MKIYRSVFLLFCFLIPIAVKGQDIEVNAEYPEAVRAGQQFTVTWIINSGGGDFAPPSFGEFYKLAGPQTSYSSSTQIINGKVTRETSYTYTYYLQAMKEGKFTLGPASFTIKNKTYRSDSIRIEVLPGSQSSGSTGSASAEPEGRAVNEDVTGEDVFVNFLVNRTEVYQGEPITATVKLYTKVDISGINEMEYPSFRNFLRVDLETPPLNSLKRENINGEIMGTGVLQQFLLYPQVSGDIVIDPVRITTLIRQRSGQSDPFFGDFFATYSNVPRAVESKPVRIKVKALPGNRPDDFSGVVGDLSIAASLAGDTVTVNNALNLKITIQGSGNLKLAGTPVLNLPPDIEVYDPKITDDLRNGTNGTSGQRTFEFLLIPRHHGDYKVPPVTYSFFNVSSGRYERVTTPELSFHALKGDETQEGIAVFGGITKEDVRYLGQDIRFIRTGKGNMKKHGGFLVSAISFFFYYAVALLAFLIVLFVRKEHIRRNSDLSLVRNRKAAGIAAKRLREASLCLKNKQADRFHEEISKALWGYLSDKLGIPLSALGRETAMATLRERGADEEMLGKLNKLLDTCEFARFAPSSSDSEATGVYEDAASFISYVENLKVKR